MEVFQQNNEILEPKEPLTAKALLGALSGVLAGLMLGAGTGLVRVYALLFYPVAIALGADVLQSIGRRKGAEVLLAMVMVPGTVLAALHPERGLLSVAMGTLLLPMGILTLGMLQRKHMGGFFTAAGVTGVTVALVYGMLCMPGILSGEGAFTQMQQEITAAEAPFVEMLLEMRGAATVEAEQQMISQFLSVLQEIPDMVPYVAAGEICFYGGMAGFLSTLLFFAFTRKYRNALYIAAPSRFQLWTMPKSFTVPVLLLSAFGFIMALTGTDNGHAVYNTITLLFEVPFIVMGLAMLDYLLSLLPRRNTLWKVLVFVGVGVLFTAVANILMMIGLFEQVFRVREKREYLLTHGGNRRG